MPAFVARDALPTLVRDVHPAPGNHRAIVEILPPCANACEATQLACEAAHTCWATVRDHCAYCFGGSNDACACWDGTAFLPDGAPCERYVSGDLIDAGTCRQGICTDD